ncbi:DUF1453 family protein [Bacillus sp. AGMB 02131]|uniref:DUF1453 family protein n=1 Tax=Peribacillus faecalis TaxID=2772559 RepID=A0A927HAE3_9BACI|nr:cytochrome c biogenesis protein CcdC [Peribacillus faecalis]MBD3107361.1 DUF1453 family protein [Peribacillus faecalis]
MLYFTLIIPILMAVAVLFIRMKAAKKPVNRKKIILPPIFMSTGALMFLHPFFRVTPIEIAEALGVGLIFSILLIKTTQFEIRDNEIYIKRSKAFAFILIALLIARIILKLIVTSTVDIGETGGMFWILAFGMIVPWRVAMLLQYKKLEKQLPDLNDPILTAKAP